MSLDPKYPDEVIEDFSEETYIPDEWDDSHCDPDVFPLMA